MHPSIANLSSRLHLCSGDVPPPLVGASATLVEPSQHGQAKGAQVYLFGGRLVSSRRMVNTLYRLDLDEMRWSRLTPTTKPKLATAEPSLQQPQPRYFHSADLWNNKIIFFSAEWAIRTAPRTQVCLGALPQKSSACLTNCLPWISPPSNGITLLIALCLLPILMRAFGADGE